MLECHTSSIKKNTSFKLKMSQRNNFQNIKVIATSLYQHQIWIQRRILKTKSEIKRTPNL